VRDGWGCLSAGMQVQTHRDLYTLWGGGGVCVGRGVKERRKGPHSLLQALSAVSVRERQREKRLRQMESANRESGPPRETRK